MPCLRGPPLGRWGGKQLTTAAPWQADFEPAAAEHTAESSVFAAFSRAPFRLLLLMVLVPVMASSWGEPIAALVLLSLAVRGAVGRLSQGWAAVVRRRLRAYATVGDSANKTAVQLAATVLAACASLGLLAVGRWLAVTAAAHLKLPDGAILLDVETFLMLEAVVLALWPLLATLVAATEARMTPVGAAALAGKYALIQAALALALPALQGSPLLWPLAGLALTTISLLAVLGVQAKEMRRASADRWAAELKRLPLEGLRAAAADAAGVPVLALAAIPFALSRGLALSFVPVALALGVSLLAESIGEAAAGVEPLTHDPSVYTDMHRARMRFRRMMDAAVLLACGAAVMMGAYGPALVRGWLVVDPPARGHLLVLAVYVVASAAAGVAARWLHRCGAHREVAVLVAADALVAVLVAMAMATATLGSWHELAALVVGFHALVLGAVLPGLAARKLQQSVWRLMAGRLWRYGLVMAPSALTAFTAAALKPPRSTREWLIQLTVVGILYLIPAFAAWNLLDSRREEG